EQERHSVVHRANEINSILNAEIDLSAAMQEIARLTPSSVKVEGVELFNNEKLMPAEGDKPLGWSGRILFATQQGYFEAKGLIDATSAAFRQAKFHRNADLRVEVLSESMPWAPGQDKPTKSSSCRFSISFEGPRS
ncbi:MAG: hypothetical protein ACI97A_004018, partial [Planctomycetota bacterium]